MKTIIAMRDDVGQHPEGQQLVETAIRSLGRPNAAGFGANILNSLEKLELHSGAGLYLGHRDVHSLEKERIAEFVERMARGLFYHVFDQRVPDNFLVKPAHLLEWNRETLKKFLNLIKNNNLREVGMGVFRFSWSEVQESPLSSVWYMEFFGIVPFGAIVRNSNPPAGYGG